MRRRRWSGWAPERLFAYAPNGEAWILAGDHLDVTEKGLLLTTDNVTQTVLRDDGTVVLVTERGLVLVDPDKGQAVETGLSAVAVFADGTYAVNFTGENGRRGTSTTVEIIDIASRRTHFVKQTCRQLPVEFTSSTPTATSRPLSGTSAVRGAASRLRAETEVLLVSPDDGTLRSPWRPVGDRAGATSSDRWSRRPTPSSGDDAVGIGMYSLRDDVLQLSLIPVASGHRSINALGLNRDGTSLVVANEASQAILRVPVTATAWSGLACGIRRPPAQTR